MRRPEDEGLISIMGPPHETAEAREQQQQQGQPASQQPNNRSRSPEGAERAVSSIGHNAEMQCVGRDKQAAAASQQNNVGVEHVRILPVRWGITHDALHWLTASNPFYKDMCIEIRTRSAALCRKVR